MLAASDDENLSFANHEGRIIFTQDEDFLKLHSFGFEHSGIVYAHQHTSIGRIVKGLVLIHQVMDSDEMENHLEFL